jgi:hypothetical protein
LRLAEQRDPFGRGPEHDALAGEAGADPERDRDVRLPGPGWSEEDHVLSGVQEVELPEVLDHLLFHARAGRLDATTAITLKLITTQARRARRIEVTG